jgi:hypothetical protein
MSSTIIDFGAIPPAGEPLKQKKHEDNAALLERDQARRLEMLKSKLSPREYRRLHARYRRLHAYLNSRQYNRLITEREDLYDQFVMAGAAYRTKPSKALERKIKELANRGRQLNKKIADLASASEEFDQLAARLKQHDQVVAFEREDAENREAFYREADVWYEQIKAVFRQSPKLHHIYKDKNGREHTRIPILKQAILQEDRIHYELLITEQNLFERWLGVWRSTLPYGVNVRDLISDETLENLSAACGRVVTYERSKASQNIFYVVSRLDSADGIPNKLLYDRVTDFYPQARHKATPWAAGVAKDRKIIWFDFEEFPHVLIAGASGGGKSNMLNQMLATFITMHSPDELRLVLVDNKGGIEFTAYTGVPHLLMPMVKHADDVPAALASVRSEMEKRLAAFEGVARDLQTFNARASKPIPRIVMIIDEMATLVGLGKTTQDIHRELRVVSSQGRAVGINLIICTQHPSVDVLPGPIKTNFTLRVASKMPNHTASQVIIDSITAAHLPDIAGRMVFRRGGFEIIAQTPYIDDSAIARAVQFAKDEYQPASQPEPTSDDEPASQPEPIVPLNQPQPRFGRAEMLDMCIEQLNGKLSPSRIHAIGGNDLMPLGYLRKMINAAVSDIQASGNVLVWKDKTYQLSKDRNAWLLTEKPSESETGAQDAPDDVSVGSPEDDEHEIS